MNKHTCALTHTNKNIYYCVWFQQPLGPRVHLQHAIISHLEHVLVVAPETDMPAARLLVDKTVNAIYVVQKSVVVVIPS